MEEYKLIKDSYSKNTKRFLKKNQNIKIEKYIILLGNQFTGKHKVHIPVAKQNINLS